MRANRSLRARSGITLTEILISIMIMGIGLSSVFALFPLGLLRMRQATVDSRSTLVAQSGVADIQSRALLQANSFSSLTWYPRAGVVPNPLIADSGFDPANDNPGDNDFVREGVWANLISVAPPETAGLPTRPFRQGPGLPFVYDPQLWAALHYETSSQPTPVTPLTRELRMGNAYRERGTPPRQGADDQPASAHGLQRLTNYVPFGFTAPTAYSPSPLPLPGYPFTYPLLGTDPDLNTPVFSSLDDMVMQGEDTTGQAAGGSGAGVGSPLIPINYATVGFQPQYDLEFGWFITARPTGVNDLATFEGDVVLCHKRPLSLDPDPNFPNVLGERTVEAVWGFGPLPAAIGAGVPSYSQGDDRLVLLRWRESTNDPRVRSGDWIADVTYERNQAVDAISYGLQSGSPGALYPGQRCHWYQVAQIVRDAEFDTTVGPDALSSFRSMVVRLATPVKAKTRLVRLGSGAVVPYHTEAALINPYVVNVYSQVFRMK